MTKAQARKRLMEAQKKLMLVANTSPSRVSATDRNKLFKMFDEIQRIHNRLQLKWKYEKGQIQRKKN